MFWRKERIKESNRGFPSDRNRFPLFLTRSNDLGENIDTSAVRAGANASYAARLISAPVCFEAHRQETKLAHKKLKSL